MARYYYNMLDPVEVYALVTDVCIGYSLPTYMYRLWIHMHEYKKESSILSSRFTTVTVHEALQTVVMTSLMQLLDCAVTTFVTMTTLIV